MKLQKDWLDYVNRLQERERQKIVSSGNGAVQAKRSLLSPDFYPYKVYSRNPGAVAMGSTIRLRSGTLKNFKVKLMKLK
ncbi:hypothetical protein [Paenibacillus polymyxa]|uniref:hypothetical protein n=1 Tax=Paenibacillus polymyxa TaxID=1406 RepID=UPI00287FC827|nr:hypothetical protein [Paenibacillus polymyxa]